MLLFILLLFHMQFCLINANLVKFDFATDCTVPELCDIVEPCKGFQPMNLSLKNNTNFRDKITFIHNGLRNRLSIKLNVSGLLKLHWSKLLEKLANRYHRRCLITTPQVAFKGLELSNKDFKLLLHKKSVKPGVMESITFNSYASNLEQTRDDFIVNAISRWYYQHQELKRPVLDKYMSLQYLELIGDNNFTHIINPHTFQIGCSYAKFHGQQSLLCFYYPTLRNEKNVTYLAQMYQDYQCTYYFPLVDKEFTRLCTLFDYSIDAGSWQNCPIILVLLLPLLLCLLLLL